MSNPYDPLLTFEEAGELLGTGPDLPRRLVATGHLDHVRTGDGVRIPQSALIAYLTVTEDGVCQGRGGPGLSVVSQGFSAVDDAVSAA
jgi:excisionase family DNA binding protein